MNKQLHFKKNIKSFFGKAVMSLAVFIFTLSAHSGILQQTKVTLNVQNTTVKEVLMSIQKQTGLNFLYNNNDVLSLKNISIDAKNESVEAILEKVLKGSNLTYIVDNKSISIVKKEKKPATTVKDEKITVKGRVLTTNNKHLAGVTVIVTGTNNGAVTDVSGDFSISNVNVGSQIEVSYVGYKSVTLKVTAEDMVIKMEEEALAVDDVVVTGIYTRKAESFTGSSKTYKAADLKRIGAQNVLQSLKTLDPSFNMMESREFGSDPNRLPDIEIRGKSSIIGLREQFETDPNQPLFILDGFETTLKTIVDLNMDRVESVTILKDAASTAIYGSKAANGVVVIETKRPEKGKFRVTYSGNMFVSMPDLSDYNLMNSQEKLQFEREAGHYSVTNIGDKLLMDSLYNNRLLDINRGVNTYWLNEPLRTAITHKHNLYAEGGDEHIRYGLGVTYNSTNGVMKQSGNDQYGVNFDIIYRKGKFLLSNKMNFDYNTQTDPTVPFSDYANTNPYYRKTGVYGDVERYLEEYYTLNKSLYSVSNPLYKQQLSSFDEKNKLDFANRLNVEVHFLSNLILRGRFGIGKSSTTSDLFKSPLDAAYDYTKYDEKGSYKRGSGEDMFYDGDLTLSFSHVSGKHQLTTVIGGRLRSDESESNVDESVGFPTGDFTRPSFASGYRTSGKPIYSYVVSRSNSLYFNGGYTYDMRYLIDANIRMDGASIFGSNKRYTTTWSVGLAWNLHNEEFVRKLNTVTLLKLRASVGNPGNQNFSSYQSFSTYAFYSGKQNVFGSGLTMDNLGNPDLKWQKTLDKNIGFDLGLMSNRLSANFDYYIKDTAPLLAEISVPSSVGSERILTNMGATKSNGVSGTVKFSPIYRLSDGINWSLSATFKHETAEYRNIGNSLDQYNQENMGNSFVRYYDGGSPTSQWAVRSLGINPADGREVFLKKNGQTTFDYDINDQEMVGNSMPKLEGVLGSILNYKGFTFSLYFRYSMGADIFNSAAYEKVENISTDNLKYNQDRRALYDRWRNPGDVAKYKSISLDETTPMSSRFVVRENYIKAESITVGYDFKSESLTRLGIQTLRVQANASDLFRISTVKEERGIEYPFARQFSFSLSLMF